MLSSVRSLSGYENELEINNSEEDFEEYNNLRFFSDFGVSGIVVDYSFNVPYTKEW